MKDDENIKNEQICYTQKLTQGWIVHFVVAPTTSLFVAKDPTLKNIFFLTDFVL
jgi:uncharacterized membrane protein